MVNGSKMSVKTFTKIYQKSILKIGLKNNFKKQENPTFIKNTCDVK